MSYFDMIKKAARPTVDNFWFKFIGDSFELRALENIGHNGVINWGDGNIEPYNSNLNYTHNYDVNSEHKITIDCDITTFSDINTIIDHENISGFGKNTTITEINFPDTILSFGDWCCWQCRSLIKVKLPKRLENISAKTFSGCSLLPSIVIPDTVTIINHFAFEYCGITTITIPKSVTTFGNGIFADSTLETIYYTGTQAKWDAITKNSNWKVNCTAEVICNGIL